MTTFKLGQFVELNGLLAVVVGTPEDSDIPAEHIAIWYGDSKSVPSLINAKVVKQPEVWTVPAEYCTLAIAPPITYH